MDSIDYGPIRDNCRKVLERVAGVAASCGRDPAEITVIGVSKLHPPEAAMAAVRAGLADLGENRTDELCMKIRRLREEGLYPSWHMIGTLQRRKVRDIIGKVSLIHSADRTELLDEISARSLAAGIVTPVLLEVNASGEASKHGFSPDKTEDLIAALSAGRPGILVRGLMTMAPLTEDERIPDLVFAKTQELFELLRSGGAGAGFDILSMGMSNDYPAAIRRGSTHVRIGTAIFGSRP